MILVTGDTHGDFSKLSNSNLGQYLSSEDYIIVAGDFGLLWSKDKEYDYWINFFKSREYTTLWVDGNHENFDWVYELPVTTWHGGKVHSLADGKVIHLMRGQVYEIENKRIFTFGGAQSHDIPTGALERDDPYFKVEKIRLTRLGIPYRINHESWWEQEVPSEEEFNEALENLAKVDNNVDIVITHALPTSMLPDVGRIVGHKMLDEPTSEYLEQIKERITFNKWYCGHYHTDSVLDDKFTVLYKLAKEL